MTLGDQNVPYSKNLVWVLGYKTSETPANTMEASNVHWKVILLCTILIGEVICGSDFNISKAQEAGILIKDHLALIPLGEAKEISHFINVQQKKFLGDLVLQVSAEHALLSGEAEGIGKQVRVRGSTARDFSSLRA